MVDICIILSTFNGSKFLNQQLTSINNLLIPNRARLTLIVRDDGSTDNTMTILKEFRFEPSIEVILILDGENRGTVLSFIDALAAKSADYYFFVIKTTCG